jgi:hypothetical protein
MKEIWGNENISLILNLDARWRWIVTFIFRAIYPAERFYFTNCMGGGGRKNRDGLDVESRRKSLPITGTEPGSPPATYTLYWLSCQELSLFR